MKVLVLSNDEKIFNSIKDKFYSYSINSKFILATHIEDIPNDLSGLIIPSKVSLNDLSIYLKHAKKYNLKTLFTEQGIISMISYFNNKECKSRKFEGSRSSFLALGSKLAEIIGGAGPLNTKYNLNWEVPIKFLPNNFLLSGINAGNGSIEALEMVGEWEIIGTIWPIFSEEKAPSGFENILSLISE